MVFMSTVLDVDVQEFRNNFNIKVTLRNIYLFGM